MWQNNIKSTFSPAYNGNMKTARTILYFYYVVFLYLDTFDVVPLLFECHSRLCNNMSSQMTIAGAAAVAAAIVLEMSI